MNRIPLVSLVLGGYFLSRPAQATSGGSTLPFNDALTTVQDNLTGPTANTIIVVICVAALVTVGMSRESSWLKPLGGAIIICALLAKAASLPSILGLGAATATPYGFVLPAVALIAFWVLTCTALWFWASALLHQTPQPEGSEG